MPASIQVLALCALLLVGPLARGAGVIPQETGGRARLGGAASAFQRSISSVFFVGKSENKNQVHYGIRLDPGCVPVGDAPVFAYWQMLERGPQVTEPLLPREEPAYGLATQQVVRGLASGRVVVRLNALPSRPIVVDTAPGPSGCQAIARTPIGGVAASLSSVFVTLRWPFGVDHLLLAGRATLDGRLVCEAVRP
jgi:hypothetical protein